MRGEVAAAVLLAALCISIFTIVRLLAALFVAAFCFAAM